MSGAGDRVAAVVPVFNPEPGLPALVRALVEDYSLVVVVDDGSVRCAERFGELPKEAVVLRHEVNAGKGKAMKTAIAWVRDARPDIGGVVFVDGDGQHHRDDVRAVASKMIETGEVAFGVRDFFSRSIPFRSRFGNVFSSMFVWALLGLRLGDTQTGLRAIPARLFGRMASLPGERYEYEMWMLGEIACLRERLHQVPIRVIYLEQNESSHFNPVVDSVKINLVLLRVALSRLFHSLRLWRGGARFGIIVA